ncbi:MAG: type III secretion system chaperone [Alphaproteobacteria bacterium]|nr:type III secretion system chaperone [Alphaproteobacteria bacterium]
MSIDAARGLVSRYGHAIGLPELTLDEDGYCGLSLGEGKALHLQYAPEDEALLVYAKAGSFDQDTAVEAMIAICMANVPWIGSPGVAVGAMPESGDVFVSCRVPVQSLDDVDFAGLLDRMTNEIESWGNRITALNAGAPYRGADGAAAAPPPAEPDGPGMIRA